MLIDYAIDVLEFLRKDRKRALIISLLFFGLVAVIFGMVERFVVLVLVAATTVVAFFVGEFQLKKFGIELVTFTAVIAGFVLGPSAGLAIGTLLMTVHLVLARSLGPYLFYCVPTMAMIGLLAGYAAAGGWFGADFVLTGIMLSLLYNAVTAGLGTVLFADFFDEMLWSGTNFALNVLLFSKVAPFALAMLA